MKLIYAIVSSDDSSSVSGALTQNGFFATKLASTGGFLMAGNTTFLICTEDENVDRVISIIAEHSKTGIAESLAAAVYAAGAEATIALMTPRELDGQEPPAGRASCSDGRRERGRRLFCREGAGAFGCGHFRKPLSGAGRDVSPSHSKPGE